MKLKSFIFSILLAGISILFVACGQKKDPSEEAFESLMKSVPANTSIFLGGYISLEDQLKLNENDGWRNVSAAINGNSAIAERLEKSLYASPDLKSFFDRLFGGSNLREVLAKASRIDPAPFAFVAYYGGNADFRATAVPFVLAATMSQTYVDAAEQFVISVKEEYNARGNGKGTWTQEVKGEKTLYVYSEKSGFSVAIAFGGNEIAVVAPAKTIEDFEAFASNPPSESLKDSAIFKKAAEGVGAHNFVAFVNFNEFVGFRSEGKRATPTEKVFRKTLESVSMFADISLDGNTANSLVRAEFSELNSFHDIVDSMAENKLATLANALPGAEYALGIGIPDPSIMQELSLKRKKKNEIFELIRQIDAKSLYASFDNSRKIASALSGKFKDLPDFFLKLDCGNPEALLSDKKNGSLFKMSESKQTIDGTDVFTSFFFGIKYALLGEKGLYVSNLFDAPAALALARGKGESAENTGRFNSIAEKIAGVNAVEVFWDNRAATEIQIEICKSGLKNSALPQSEIDGIRSTIAFMELWLAMEKKSISGMALRRNGAAIELYCVCKYDYDLNAFAEAIKNLK